MAINKVVFGSETLVDLTEDTITADALDEGVTAHDASGQPITGTRAPQTALPNPYALTFTGAVTAEYDGSEAVSVAIPAPADLSNYPTYDNMYSYVYQEIRKATLGGGYTKIVDASEVAY